MTELCAVSSFAAENDWKGGIAYIEKLPEPLSEELRSNLGFFYSRDREHAKAIEIFSELCKERPDAAFYCYMLGYQYYDMAQIEVNAKKPCENNFAKAAEWFEKALTIRPDYFSVKYRLMYAYTKLQHKKAMSDASFRRSIELAESADVQYANFDEFDKLAKRSDYSDICFTHGKQIEGFTKYAMRTPELFATAVKLSPSDVDKRYRLAKAYFNICRYEDAKKALIVDARKPYTKALRARICFRLRDFDGFKKSFDPRCFRLPYATEGYCLDVMRAFYLMEDYSEALKYAEISCRKYPESENCGKALEVCRSKCLEQN